MQQIRVREGRLDVEIAVSLTCLHVEKDAAARACELLPNLPMHVCVNQSNSPRFGDEIEGTELAHLIEHILIELQGQAYKSAGRSARFRGHTSWADELSNTRDDGFALMRVVVSFYNDFIALTALHYACEIAEWCAGGDPVEHPRVDEMVARLQQLIQS